MSKKVAFHTLGCKVNQYESVAMAEQFKKKGYEVVSEDDVSDIYIINTCTVTNLADRKSRQYIRRMKQKAPDAFVCVTGCYSQVKPEELEAMPEVDLVTGNGDKGKLIEYIEEAMREKAEETIVNVRPYETLNDYNDRGIIMSMEGKTRAFIKIEEGCDRFCAYCLIPFARGHVRSRDPNEVVEEAKALIENGFKEIVLTGINTALYGTEEGFAEKFGEGLYGIERIIKEINALPGKFRIRLSSLEPNVVNAEYVKRLLKYEKLCPHIHLSIQSGSDKVIRAMNRHYTRDEYLDIVKVLRAYDPGYGITTDIIVGFPGETEEDFADSLDMVEQVEFVKVHTFKYSKRKGTKAEKLKDQVPGDVKNDRSDRLIALGDSVGASFMDKLVGTVREVLFEEVVSDKETGEKYLTGYADNYVKVYVSCDKDLQNELKSVKLLGRYLDGMKGELQNG